MSHTLISMYVKAVRFSLQSALRKSELKEAPLGSFPMSLCTLSLPYSSTARAYVKHLLADCIVKADSESPTQCLFQRENDVLDCIPMSIRIIIVTEI